MPTRDFFAHLMYVAEYETNPKKNILMDVSLPSEPIRPVNATQQEKQEKNNKGDMNKDDDRSDIREIIVDMVLEDAGVDLWEYMNRKCPFLGHQHEHFALRAHQVRRFTTKIVECVTKMHLFGFVHLDLKSENICVREYLDRRTNKLCLQMKLIDFGYAQKRAVINSAEHRHALDGKVVGTDPFRSCEMLWGARVDLFHADLWSLGQLIWNLYVGVTPWNKDVASREQRNLVFRYFLHHENWDSFFDLPHEVTALASFPDFVSFIALLCCKHKRPDDPVLSLLQHPFLLPD